MQLQKYSKAMVFGVFDHFHKGHEYFLQHAKSKCDILLVVVTMPEIVVLLKKQEPDHALAHRISDVKKFNESFIVIAGDATLGEWSVFKQHKPDRVILGYDQQGIAHELDKMNMPYEYIDAYHPEKYKSSLFKQAFKKEP